MNELIKYFEALEARLAAQEARIATLEQRLAETEMRLAEAEQRLAEQAQAEPEVEVDLVYPEEEEATVELPQEEPASEPEPAAEPVAEPEPAVVPEPQPTPAPEPVPAPEPKPEAPRAPLQTSLFGAPVTDIRQAVSIGDRFLFQRELFAGSAEKLQKTLSELDNLHSLDEALAYIEKFGWDKQSPTHELFLNVLRRRFQ